MVKLFQLLMLYRKILLFVFLILTIVTHAQTQLVGIKSGVNLTNVTNNKIYSNCLYKLGFGGGFTYEYLFKNKISLGVDFLYAQKGFEQKLNFILGDPLDPVRGNITVDPNTSSSLPTKIYHRYDFISVPIKISYSYGKKLYGMGSIGFMPSYMIAEKVSYDNYPTKSYLDIEKAKRFEFSGIAELGAGYQFKKRWHLVFSTSYFYAFNGINGANYYLYDDIKNYGFNASLGLKYQLGNK